MYQLVLEIAKMLNLLTFINPDFSFPHRVLWSEYILV